MKNKKLWLAPIIAVACLGAVSCTSTENGKSIQGLEEMTDVDFNKWKLYLQLGTQIGANRLLKSGAVSESDLEIAATALETLRDQDVVPGVESGITTALEDAGLTNEEVKLLLLIVEQELLARGALDWINPDTQMVELSPRTQDLLTLIAKSLRDAANVTSQNLIIGEELEAEFNGKLL